MNKGLQIRSNKLKKQTQKRNVIKLNQELLCRYVTIKYQVIERVNGNYKHKGETTVNGLQIKNKVYLDDGSYKLINSKNVKIIKEYDDVPNWATNEMRDKQENFK